MSLLQLGIEAVERGWVPDSLTRVAIRRLCRRRLQCDSETGPGTNERRHRFLASLSDGPIALVPDLANEQHYEVPAEFFAAVLGPRRKYSCCYFESPTSTLAEAEEAALTQTCQRAELADGQRVLELGCGWGSLSLWMAEHYPNSEIVAVSNSHSQRRYITDAAARLGFNNLSVVTQDMNEFVPRQPGFDRVVSVEMFEHMRNYRQLLSRIAGWLRDDGRLFVHIFCHRQSCYPFETEGAANWMGRHFFSGGIMPSADLLSKFNEDLVIDRQYRWNGDHYRRTSEAWLQNLDGRREELQSLIAGAYGPGVASRLMQRWRVFFLAVAELFGYGSGDEWFVSHYLMRPAD